MGERSCCESSSAQDSDVKWGGSCSDVRVFGGATKLQRGMDSRKGLHFAVLSAEMHQQLRPVLKFQDLPRRLPAAPKESTNFLIRFSGDARE
ncbi:MAG: hypothetical protein RLZZ09_845 [Pseudomonadota bacterium]|jgi:hypothetical protein